MCGFLDLFWRQNCETSFLVAKGSLNKLFVPPWLVSVWDAVPAANPDNGMELERTNLAGTTMARIARKDAHMTNADSVGVLHANNVTSR